DVHSDVAGLNHFVDGLGELPYLVVSVHDPVGAERVGQAFGGGGGGHGSGSSGVVVPRGGRRDLVPPEGGGDVVPPSEVRQRSETCGVIPRHGGVDGVPGGLRPDVVPPGRRRGAAVPGDDQFDVMDPVLQGLGPAFDPQVGGRGDGAGGR